MLEQPHGSLAVVVVVIFDAVTVAVVAIAASAVGRNSNSRKSHGLRTQIFLSHAQALSREDAEKPQHKANKRQKTPKP